MSGIACYYKDTKPNKDILKEMLEKIKHRGPDKEETYLDNNIALGANLLRLSKNDKALITNEDKTIIAVCDGNILNYKELRLELEKKKHKFLTSSNLEILTHGYEEWNHNLSKKIRGEFAFIIWDKNKKEIYASRDPWGSKPIYYYQNENTLLIASESKAFLNHPSFNKLFNEQILSAYLCFNTVPTEETFFQGVKRLKPGHQIIYKNNHVKDEEYFSLKFKKTNKSLEAYADEIEDAVKESVKLHNSKEVKVGSFLSSGIDSSYLVSILKPEKTYTIGYKDLKYDEVSYAKDLTSKLGIQNKQKIISPEDFLKHYKKITYYMDEPLANPSLPAIYYLTKMASMDVKVVFSGEGADELFGGYNSYQEEVTQSWYMKIPFSLRSLASKIVSKFPEKRGLNFIYRRGLKLSDYNIGLGRVFKDEEALSIVKNKKQITTKEITAPYYEKYKDEPTLNQRQVIDYYFWLVNDFSYAVDRTCAMFSIAGTTPYLDTKVYEAAMSLPKEAKINTETTKIALRQAAKRTIPNESYKKKKLGFPVPLREWMKLDEYYKEIKEKFESNIAKQYFEVDKILALLEDHKNGKKDNYKKVWAIYTFIVWYQIYFEN